MRGRSHIDDVLELARFERHGWEACLAQIRATGVPTNDGPPAEVPERETPRFRTVEEIEGRLGSIRSELNEITEATAGRIVTDAETERWNSLNEEMDELNTIASQMEQMQARMEQVSERPNTREGAHFQVARRRATSDIYDLWAVRQAARGPEDELRMLVDNAKRSLERETLAHPDLDQADGKAHIERLLGQTERVGSALEMPDGYESLARRMLMTGKPEYRRAFMKTLARMPLSPEEQRALSTTTTAGGFAVPYTLDPTIIPTSNSSVNPYRAISNVKQINTTTWQGVTSAGVTAHRRGEAAQAQDDAPTLGQPEATPTRVDVFVPFSIEIGQDWTGLESALAVAIQDAKDDEEASSFTSGNGVAPNPQGVLSGATTVVTGAGTALFAIADVYSVYNALPPRFKPRAQWVGNEAIYNLVRQFDTNGGANIWIDNLQLPTGGLGVPTPGNLNARLMGRGASEASAMSGSVATGNLILVIGDFGRYFLIVDRIGMTVDLIPHLFGTQQMPTGQRGLFAFWRNTSVVLSANAFRVLKVR